MLSTPFFLFGKQDLPYSEPPLSLTSFNIVSSMDKKPSDSLQEETSSQAIVSNSILSKDTPYDISIIIHGMVCSFCAQGITNAFKKQGPVKQVQVDIDERAVHLQLKLFRKLSDSSIQELVKDAGYDVERIERH